MKAPELPGGGCCCGGDKPAEEMEAKKWNVNSVAQNIKWILEVAIVSYLTYTNYLNSFIWNYLFKI